MMENTFKLVGQGSAGTAFILGRPLPGDSSRGAHVLVTAAHVLEKMVADSAVLSLRRKGPTGEWSRVELALPIRDGPRPLWTKHPRGDVAVMQVNLPAGVLPDVVPTSVLATDSDFEALGLHPGDELACLGFPLGVESSPVGFPVLRGARIASYPVVATPPEPTFLLDFHVFPGNSGGPVYMQQRTKPGRGDTLVEFGYFNWVLGLVSQEVRVSEERGIYREIVQHPLGLAVVVRSSVIRQTVEMLPPAK